MSNENNNEYTFAEAWRGLFEGNIVTSKNSNYSYAADHEKGKVKLKYFNPVMGIWQICNYFSADELLDKWYITDKN